MTEQCTDAHALRRLADRCSVMQAYVPALNGVDFDVAEPQLFPDVGLWHPLAPTMYEDLKEYLNWCAATFQDVPYCDAHAGVISEPGTEFRLQSCSGAKVACEAVLRLQQLYHGEAASVRVEFLGSLASVSLSICSAVLGDLTTLAQFPPMASLEYAETVLPRDSQVRHTVGHAFREGRPRDWAGAAAVAPGDRRRGPLQRRRRLPGGSGRKGAGFTARSIFPRYPKLL